MNKESKELLRKFEVMKEAYKAMGPRDTDDLLSLVTEQMGEIDRLRAELVQLTAMVNSSDTLSTR